MANVRRAVLGWALLASPAVLCRLARAADSYDGVDGLKAVALPSDDCLPLPAQVPAKNTPELSSSGYDDVSDEAYHSLLKGTVLCDKSTLWNDTNASDPLNTGRELWAFGRADSSNLYVFGVGTEASCLQYADTLYAISKADYYVLCPSVYNYFPDEWAMKLVVAVKWALASHSYKNIALGGHSGGGPAALAAGSLLAKEGTSVKGFVMQHPGAVPDFNVPGCERFAHHDGRKLECQTYYPEDMLSRLEGPILVTTGSFCQLAGADKSNWYKAYKNVSAWVANPSDCIVDTAYDNVYPTFLAPTAPVQPPPKGGIVVQHCGEHQFSVLGPPGLEAEGKPMVLPFLAAVATGTPKPADFASILALNGKTETCVEQLTSNGDRSLKLVQHDEVRMRYMLPSSSERSTCTYEWLSASSVTKVTATAQWLPEGTAEVVV